MSYGAPDGIRTHGPQIKSLLRYQLRHWSILNGTGLGIWTLGLLIKSQLLCQLS